MSIEYVVESLDKVGDDLKPAYVEADGKFNFDPDKYAELKAAGLKKKNGEILGKLKQAESELGRFGKFKSLAELMADADETELEEFQANWQKRNEKDASKGKPGEDSIKLKEQLERAHARALKAREDEAATLKADLQKAQVELTKFKLWTPLRETAIKAGLDPADWEVAQLELSYQQRFGFDEDGKVVVMEDGQPSTVTPEKFFRDVYSDQRPKFYKASNAGGGGAQNNTRGNGSGKKTMPRAEFEALSQPERMKLAKTGVEFVD